MILPFFSWLADPQQDWQGILTAIEQHPDLNMSWDFSDIGPAIQRQEPPRPQLAQYFIDFWTKKIDLKTLKQKLGKK